MSTKDRTIIHGHNRRGKTTTEYNSWRGMIERCENPRHIGYKYYGARGIKVCARWHSFADFLADMGRKPKPRYTIDRIDTDGDYTPGNCRWATPRKQRLNQRPYDESVRVRKAWVNRSRVSKRRIDMVGRRFARLTVIKYVDTKDKRARWLCKCSCGQTTIVTGKALRSGNTASCGCRQYTFGRE